MGVILALVGTHTSPALSSDVHLFIAMGVQQRRSDASHTLVFPPELTVRSVCNNVFVVQTRHNYLEAR